MFEVAPDFPDTSFAWGTATDVGAEQGLENIFAYEARAEEGGYVNGVLAANLSQSGVLGVVGPVEAGDAKLYIDGFVAGANAANPDGQVNVSYTGSFGDIGECHFEGVLVGHDLWKRKVKTNRVLQLKLEAN